MMASANPLLLLVPGELHEPSQIIGDRIDYSQDVVSNRFFLLRRAVCMDADCAAELPAVTAI